MEKTFWAKRAGAPASLVDEETYTEIAYVWRFGPQMGSVWYAAHWDKDGIVRLGGGKGYGVEWAKKQLESILNTGQWETRAQMTDA